MGDTGEIAAVTSIDTPEETANGNAAAQGEDLLEATSGRIPTAGEMLEAAVAEARDGDVGSFVGRDEPSEYSYDYALADQRAVDALRRVLEAEGAELDPAFQPGGENLAERLDEEGTIMPRAADDTTVTGWPAARGKLRDAISGSLRGRRRT